MNDEIDDVLSRLLDCPEDEIPFDDPADIADMLDELYEVF